MMDSDEYDDDIADEDLIVAASQVPDRVPATATATATATVGHSNGASRRSQPHVLNSFGSRRITPAKHSNETSYIDLDDLPSDAFASSPACDATGGRGSQTASRLTGRNTTFRQTTLFGRAAQVEEASTQSQFNSNRAFRVDLPPEAPSHHDLDVDAMKTWVYPTNLGPSRDYQFSIVKNSLFNNVLVALPTGLGKTFIAATVMLNYYRWTKKAKIIFMAPTKPLVAQQVDACFNIAGIPRSETTLLTGEVSSARRAEEWETKRVFFMTPQTLENDLSHGTADPKSIALLVVDEAHRATGNYSYVKVVSFMRRFSNSFRVLALTATPGTTVESIQQVIDNLGISHVEIRTEESIDLRQYIHKREEDIIALDPSEEMVLVKDLFSKALKPLVDKLSQQNIYFGRDPMSLTTYGLVKAKESWQARSGHVNQGVKFMMAAVFSILQTLAHAIKLLNFHGIKPFYDNIVQFRDEVEGKGQKASKNKKQIIESPSFQEMMKKVSSWCSKANFVSHPKLAYLSDTVLNHFIDAGEGREGSGSSNTRIIVFSEYRDSAEEIVRTLNIHKPLIRAAVFVGQADSKRSDGMKQSEQTERIRKFKDGEFNVLVATSIGEEGLDIGQVDLIICFDASASPIRMLQRMGRTGRKRAGRVVLLLMRGKEEDNYAKSKDAYEKLQAMICNGGRFTFRPEISPRIVPREIRPEVDMRPVEIPVENTQNNSLPEPRKGARKKRPPKKFNMPDGVETGFTSVSSMLGKLSNPTKTKATQPIAEEQAEVAPVPDLNRVVLRRSQVNELDRMYKNLPFHHQDQIEYIKPVNLKAQPIAQRTLRKTVHLKHGEYTKRCVRLFRVLARAQSASDRYTKPYGDSDESLYTQLPLPEGISDTEDEPAQMTVPRKKRKASLIADEGPLSDLEELPNMAAAIPTRKKPKKAPVRKRQNPFLSSDIPEDGDTDGDEHEHEEEEDSPPPAPMRRAQAPKKQRQEPKTIAPKARGRKPPKKKSQPAAAAAGLYDESADEGDDCRRTSDLELTDESDDGSDLADFVVGDDVAISSNIVTSSLSVVRRRRRRSTSPTSPSSAPGSSRVAARPELEPEPRPRPWYEPAQFPTSQESDGDDDVPSMSQIVKKKKKIPPGPISDSSDEQGAAGGDDDDDDDDDVPVRKSKGVAERRGKKRRLVFDEEEEEEDDDDDNSGEEGD